MAVVAPAAVEHIYVSSVGGGYLLGNDFRAVAGAREFEIDKRSVYALLSFGNIPAPLTPSLAVQRVPAGHRWTWKPELDRPAVDMWWALPAPAGVGHSAAESLGSALGSVLQAVPMGTVLFFSGGVDSGLLAAHLKAVGRDDVKLVNFSFGDEDNEARQARAVAQAVGSELHVVNFDRRQLPAMLGRIGRDYGFPFGDYSVIPTNLLVHGTLERIGDLAGVIDGTGADGLFGMGGKYEKWRRVYRVPTVARMAAGELYRIPWVYEKSSRIEYLCRLSRRSARMALPEAGVLAQNALDGIAYHVPGQVGEELSELLARHVYAQADAVAPEGAFSWLDIVQVCCMEYAAKVHDPLRQQNVDVIFPFLQNEVVELAYGMPAAVREPDGVPKGLLKDMLRKVVPASLVDRRKSGFVPPIREIFAAQETRDILAGALIGESSVVSNFLDQGVVKRLLDRAAAGRPLSQGAYSLLWAGAFMGLWCEQNGYARH